MINILSYLKGAFQSTVLCIFVIINTSKVWFLQKTKGTTMQCVNIFFGHSVNWGNLAATTNAKSQLFKIYASLFLTPVHTVQHVCFGSSFSYVDSGPQFPFIFLCYYPLQSHRLLLNTWSPTIKELKRKILWEGIYGPSLRLVCCFHLHSFGRNSESHLHQLKRETGKYLVGLP